MRLKIFYCGPLLIKFGSDEESPIFEIDLRDLTFGVAILAEYTEVSIADFYLGEIPLSYNNYLHLEDILEKKYQTFYGKIKLLKKLATHNIQNRVFKVMYFGTIKELTGQQILDLLALD